MDGTQLFYFSILAIVLYCIWNIQIHLTREFDNKVFYFDKYSKTFYFTIYSRSISLETYKLIKNYNKQLQETKPRNPFMYSIWAITVQICKIVSSVILGAFLAPFFVLLILLSLILGIYVLLRIVFYISYGS
jgi:hypothetical protein